MFDTKRLERLLTKLNAGGSDGKSSFGGDYSGMGLGGLDSGGIGGGSTYTTNPAMTEGAPSVTMHGNIGNISYSGGYGTPGVSGYGLNQSTNQGVPAAQFDLGNLPGPVQETGRSPLATLAEKPLEDRIKAQLDATFNPIERLESFYNKDLFAQDGQSGLLSLAASAGLDIPGIKQTPSEPTWNEFVDMDDFLARNYPEQMEGVPDDIVNAKSYYSTMLDKQIQNNLMGIPTGAGLATMLGGTPVGTALSTMAGLAKTMLNAGKTMKEVQKSLNLSAAEMQAVKDLDLATRTETMRRQIAEDSSRVNRSDSGGSLATLASKTPQTESEQPASPTKLPDWLTGGPDSFNALIPTLKVGGVTLADLLADKDGGLYNG